MTLTELTALPDERLRVLCAEACGMPFAGYYESLIEPGKMEPMYVGEDCPACFMPDYPASHDAMAGARATLTDEEQKGYAVALRELVVGCGFPETDAQLYELLNATPRQQCIAFLLVKGAA